MFFKDVKIEDGICFVEKLREQHHFINNEFLKAVHWLREVLLSF